MRERSGATKKPFFKAALVLAAVIGALLLLMPERHEMKTISMVEAPDSRKPLFPDSCVVCNRPRGEQLIMLSLSDEHSRVDFYLHGIDPRSAQGTLLQVPAHDICVKGVRNDFLKRVLLALMVAAAVAAFGVIQQYNTVLSIAAAIISAAALLSVQFTKPVPFEFWRYDNKYVLLFQDRNYAEQVARLNQAKVQECVNAYMGLPLKAGIKK